MRNKCRRNLPYPQRFQIRQDNRCTLVFAALLTVDSTAIYQKRSSVICGYDSRISLPHVQKHHSILPTKQLIFKYHAPKHCTEHSRLFPAFFFPAVPEKEQQKRVIQQYHKQAGASCQNIAKRHCCQNRTHRLINLQYYIHTARRKDSCRNTKQPQSNAQDPRSQQDTAQRQNHKVCQNPCQRNAIKMICNNRKAEQRRIQRKPQGFFQLFQHTAARSGSFPCNAQSHNRQEGQLKTSIPEEPWLDRQYQHCGNGNIVQPVIHAIADASQHYYRYHHNRPDR